MTEVVCCDAVGHARNEEFGFKIHTLGPGKYGYAYSPRLLPWLRQNISAYDAVILDGLWLWTSLAAHLARKNSSPRPKLFIMPHGMLDPWFQRDSSRRLKAWRNFFYWLAIERHVVNSADGLLFTSEEELNLARQTFPVYKPKQEYVVGLGASQPPAFAPQMGEAFRRSCPSLGNRRYFLYLARINPKKGVDLLVQAYSDVLKSQKLKADCPELVIAGPGWDSEYGRKIQSLIASMDCGKNIHMVGMLEGNAKWGALYGCEAFILPSHQENFGIAVVEALACNKPVLISDKVNIWREIDSDRAGIVESDTLHGTRQLFQRFLKGEFFEADNRFWNCYNTRFHIHSAAERMVNVIEDSLCR
jgi:glycosyltransferase involved in cell wall biosynthesis